MTSAGRRAPRLGGAFALVLRSARAGRPAGHERLYQAYAGAVAGYLRLQGAGDPDDLANQVFFDAFSALGDFEGDEDGFRSWLFTIAHRRLIDDRRHRARRPQAAGGRDPAEDPETCGGDAEDDAMRRLGTERVRTLCAGLPPDQRDVLLLRMVAGFGIQETADALGKTPNAVKALQHRAVNALRRQFEREGVSS